MAFDDLEQAEQAESDRASKPDTGEEGGSADPSVTPTPDAGADSGPNSTATNEPAFEFEEAKQRPLYARQAAWDAFEDALAIDVEPSLRRHDVRDASKRELHDAALRVLAEHADEVADRVLTARGLDTDTIS
jgi:hypothetical protein